MADDDKDIEDDKENADAPEGEEGAEGEESGGSKKKKLIIIAAAVVLLLVGGGAGAYFTGLLDGVLGLKPDCVQLIEDAAHGDAAEHATEDGELPPECLEEATKTAETPGFFIDIPDLIVNLNAGTRNPHFLKMTIKVELESQAFEAAFNDALPRVVDQFQTYLRELRMEDLRGSAGLYRMKLELLTRVKAAVPAAEVRDILFQEILVQ